jgi:(p)ppGpp synthase/HD superfamily hydrolase
MKTTPLIQKAIDFASKRHEGQTRKFSGLPYFTHPENVSKIVHDYCGRAKNYEILVVAALFHDLLEDTNTTEQEIASEFDPEIAYLVKELTSDEEEIKATGKTEYMKKKFEALSDDALILKLADRLDNMLDSPAPKTVSATIEIIQHLLANRILNFTQKRLADEILDVCTHLN